uniref:prostaglandin E2 receptor EP2 subtype isoform X3 n=1 Tax=Vespula vulgaris TaxID=7454 RepID=UPI00223BCC1E|nr:prostaglandin E2 receptor EP2 subtype isoform X3 [Vespula vulgaris]
MKMIEKITSSFHTEALQNDSLSIVDLASTMMTMNVTVPNIPKRHVTFISQAVLTLVYITGVIGNVSALVILFHRDKRRNRKHLLMLRCLASNDLVALLGMLVQMYISIYVAGVTSNRAFCSLRVVWRLFGLFSGCVAIVMAAERWLALTRPFVYQKQVTYPVIVRCMLALWLAALSLTSLPVLGFGLYYKDDHCVRYREATELTDIAYAYVWFVFGTLLCLSIVWCNLAVSRALGTLGRRAGALRRISRASSRAKPLLTVTGPTPEVVATAEERAFARLMAVLSISFVVCWMPQMTYRYEILSIISSLLVETKKSQRDRFFFFLDLPSPITSIGSRSSGHHSMQFGCERCLKLSRKTTKNSREKSPLIYITEGEI